MKNAKSTMVRVAVVCVLLVSGATLYYLAWSMGRPGSHVAVSGVAPGPATTLQTRFGLAVPGVPVPAGELTLVLIRTECARRKSESAPHDEAWQAWNVVIPSLLLEIDRLNRLPDESRNPRPYRNPEFQH